jgi:predicted PurR-regulated permease PerM
VFPAPSAVWTSRRTGSDRDVTTSDTDTPPPPSPRGSPQESAAPSARQPPGPGERGAAIGQGLSWLATWGLRLVLVSAGAVVLWFVLGKLWSVVLPVLLGLLLASVLWPPVAWLRRHGAPPALASAAVLLGFLAVFLGGLVLLAPSVTSQVGDIATQATEGLRQLQTWVTGPPLELGEEQVNSAVQAIVDRLQSSATVVASGVLSGVTAVGSLLVTAALALVLTFFFLKDGPRFLPWLNALVGVRAGRHLDVVLTRSWSTLGSFVQGQAAVGLVDAVLIGAGLVVTGVPLALPLAVLTFLGGFVPIIGAFVIGALAVLVALVTKGVTTALVVLVIILAVQQIEGNVLQPILQGRSLQLHPALVLVAVTAGGGLYGVAGAFLAVPVVAVAAVVLRYLGDVIDGRVDAAEEQAAVPGSRTE